MQRGDTSEATKALAEIKGIAEANGSSDRADALPAVGEQLGRPAQALLLTILARTHSGAGAKEMGEARGRQP